MNQVCFDAFTLGNHEFDSGDAGLKKFLDYLKAGSCATPTSVVSANTLPQVGVSPLTPKSATDYFTPYVIKEINGQKFGIIGIETGAKTKGSSSPDATTQFADEAATIQQYVNSLTLQGITKIILLSHMGYDNDLAIEKKVSGIDIIVGGDSHTLLGDGFTQYGLTPPGSYPTKVSDIEGKTVCIVHASQYAEVVGELNINFDANGDVSSCSGTPHMLLGDTFKRSVNGVATELTGTDRTAVLQAINDSNGLLNIVTSDAVAQANLDTYSAQVNLLKQTIIGKASETLCLERIPGQGQSKTAGCTASTVSHGSDISNIVAKGFLKMSTTSDMCLQNGGGVRIDVPAGDISISTAYTLLPFANTLTEINITGQEIIDTLEDAVASALAGTTGAYPYAAGLRWDVDLSKAKGQRITNVQVNSRVAGSWTAIDRTKTYKLVTNNFTARGQDNYTTLGNIPSSRKLDTYLDYAQSFVDYVKQETAAGRTLTKLPVAEYSTQTFIDKNGVQK